MNGRKGGHVCQALTIKECNYYQTPSQTVCIWSVFRHQAARNLCTLIQNLVSNNSVEGLLSIILPSVQTMHQIVCVTLKLTKNNYSLFHNNNNNINNNNEKVHQLYIVSTYQQFSSPCKSAALTARTCTCTRLVFLSNSLAMGASLHVQDSLSLATTMHVISLRFLYRSNMPQHCTSFVNRLSPSNKQ